MQREESPLSSIIKDRLHGPEGGTHACCFCQRPYNCEMVHFIAGEAVLPGSRCCPDCRVQNMKDARRLRARAE